MAKILNNQLIHDDPNFYNFIQVHERGEDKSVSLSKQDQHVLYFLHNRYSKNNKLQENDYFPTHHYHIQYIKYVQHKKINMS